MQKPDNSLLPAAAKKYTSPKRNNERTIIKQSNSEVYAKYDYTAIEKRIHYALVFLSSIEPGIDTIIGRVDVDENKRRFVTIPIKILMGKSKSHNYDDIRNAIDSFNTKTIWHTDENGNWVKAYPLIAVYLTQSRGNVILKIDSDIWNAFSAESNYYSELDILQAMQFNSPIQMRLYEIANSLLDTKVFDIDYLRDIWCMGDKYDNNGNFIRHIERALKAVNKSDRGLLLEKLYSGSSHLIDKIALTPFVNCNEKEREYAIKERLKKCGLKWVLAPYELLCLRNAGFTEQGICNNIVTLKIRQEQMRLLKYEPRAFGDLITRLYQKSKDKDNPQGWIIDSLKQMNKEAS